MPVSRPTSRIRWRPNSWKRAEGNSTSNGDANLQGPIWIEEAHNSPDFAYLAPSLLLAPRRYQLSVKFTW